MSVFEKLVAIQRDLNAPKDQYNSFGKYKYRNAEGILEAVKPLLAEHGLFLTVSDDVVTVGDRVYVRATATVSDGEQSVSVLGWAREAAEKKGMDAAMLTGATSSYAKKYALNGLFSIDDSKDSDSDEAHRMAGSSGAGTNSSPSAARTAPSNGVEKARADAVAALKANNVDGDAVKKFVRDLGFTGLSQVDNVDDLRKVVAWAELGAK